MRTTITIEDSVLDQLLEYTRAKTKTQAVNQALADWVRRLKIEKLRSMRGKFHIEDNWKELRALEARENRSTYGKRSR